MACLTGLCRLLTLNLCIFVSLFCLLFFPGLGKGQTPALIPVPESLEMGSGTFMLSTQTRFYASNPEVRALIQEQLPFLKSASSPAGATVFFEITPKLSLGREGYDLHISPKSLTLKATQMAGLFYGLQTLRQLLPVSYTASSYPVPALHIRDQPRFGWRGLMLDVSRHFFDKAFVKRYIDQMARYKFNVFHWHLTDDQGWRIEIKSLPKLTQVGAWRVPRTGRWWDIANPESGEVPSYGGFYTQDDIREVVAYAQQRHITVIPEIDMPGHIMSAIAAYPHLTCEQAPAEVPPNGKFYKLKDNTLNPCNESTYAFIDQVFTEVAQLFPAPYIHVGGDEAYKGFWEKCESCRQTMQTHQLKNVEELQSYFIKRVEKIVQSKGKKLIGWDEILEGGLAPDATVMSWHGLRGGIEAAKQNHPVIMTPFQFSYLDLYQGDPAAEPASYGNLKLSTTYTLEPLPDSVDATLVLGGQGNLWTENVPHARHVEYMTWPRAFAIAEILWSPRRKRDFPEFLSRVENHFKRFDEQGVNYARSVYNPFVSVQKHPSGSLEIVLEHEIPGTQLYYTTDNTLPDSYAPLYTQPFLFPKGSDRIKVLAYRAGKPLGRLLEVSLADLEKRAK
ncbi:beta-N-acetylhexosaminidase [Siphonobacter sp. SORGH_AS_0500]|uniref:beta-N-acetylhexosaminidase n=1 Tax=Siphonobacter sp. SORGH_AS_0500 TaxID=1864824 RepID=UPI000CAE8905|nr:beta-N-acetylhexosaminidase [Siphonobacter sp. SORGH_AS_0500]